MALRSWLLNPEDYHFLFQARVPRIFLNTSRPQFYGAALKGCNWRAPMLRPSSAGGFTGSWRKPSVRWVGGLKRGRPSHRQAGGWTGGGKPQAGAAGPATGAALPDPAVQVASPLCPGLSHSSTLPRIGGSGDHQGPSEYLAPTPWGPPLAGACPMLGAQPFPSGDVSGYLGIRLSASGFG